LNFEPGHTPRHICIRAGARPYHICTGTWGSPLHPHLHQDSAGAHRDVGLTPPIHPHPRCESAGAQARTCAAQRSPCTSPRSVRRDRGSPLPAHIGAGTGLSPPTSAPGPGSAPPHRRRDSADLVRSRVPRASRRRGRRWRHAPREWRVRSSVATDAVVCNVLRRNWCSVFARHPRGREGRVQVERVRALRRDAHFPRLGDAPVRAALRCFSHSRAL
jgi:hypothetical protein